MGTILDIDYNNYTSVIKGFTVELVVKSSPQVGELKSDEYWQTIFEYREYMLSGISKHFDVPLEKVYNDHRKYIEWVEEIGQEN